MCKWVDEDGCVHYAETCPEDVESTDIEIQPPPSQQQSEEASERYSDTKIRKHSPQATSPGSSEQPPYDTNQMRDQCIQAKLSLDALSRNLPVYYDKMGQLQAEFHQSVRFRYDRSGSYLEDSALKQVREYWRLVEKDNCTTEVLATGVKSEVRKKKKAHQKRECDAWKTELQFMERNKSFHEERLDLKKLFNAKCK